MATQPKPGTIEPIRYPFTLSYSATCYIGACGGSGLVSGDLPGTLEWAREALINDPTRDRVTVESWALCVACDGSGRTAKRRFAWVPCKACKGEGQRMIAVSTVRREA